MRYTKAYFIFLAQYIYWISFLEYMDVYLNIVAIFYTGMIQMKKSLPT